MSRNLDRLIQARALELRAKGELTDKDGRLVELRIDSSGKPHVSKYAITKIALEKFANGKLSGDS